MHRSDGWMPFLSLPVCTASRSEDATGKILRRSVLAALTATAPVDGGGAADAPSRC